MKLSTAFLAAALLFPLALPPATAQPPADALRLLEDAGADVRVASATGEQDPAGRWAAADLRALDVRETPDEVTFTLTVASLAASPEAPLAESVQYAIGFRHADQAYRVSLYRNVFFGTPFVYGFLEAYNPARQEYQQVGPFQEASQDVAASTLAFAVDRSLLLDRSGNAPHPEVPLADWSATAVGNPAFGFRFRNPCPAGQQTCLGNPVPTARDAMPDQGNGTAVLVPHFGVAQQGHARLSSETPTRASNGEATTIVYQVVAQNRGPANDTFQLTASGVPEGWQVRLPAARVTVPGGNATVTLPVVLSVPFTHQHGAYQHFRVEMASLTDPGAVGRIQLGIRYSNPPQPAGHHDTLWLHSLVQPGFTGSPADTVFQFPQAFMNARANDPLDARAEVPAYGCGIDIVSEDLTPRNHFCWSIPLLPQLELGLDFDLRRAGTLTLPVKTLLPLPSATLEGRLVYVSPEGSHDGPGFGFDTVDLATLVPHPPVDVAPNSEGNLLSADLVPTPDGDYVPYRKGAALHLEVRLSSTGVPMFNIADTGMPALQPGGMLTALPLNEYHDKVTQVFSSNATLHLVANSPQDRVTNPGKTLLFNLTLANDGAAGAFDLELTGTHLDWARIIAPGDRVRLSAGESVPVQVAVQVPRSADTGDRADLVLAATSAADLNVRSLARLLATVDTSVEYPDEALLGEQVEQERKTPALPAAAAVALLAALAALARRRP